MKPIRKAGSRRGPSTEPLPEGDYPVILTGAEEGLSRSSGKPMTTLEFQVGDTSRKLREYITTASDWKWDEVAAAYGCFFQEGEEFDFDTDDFIGRSCHVHINIEQYQNKSGEDRLRNNIAYFIAKEEGSPTPTPPPEPPAPQSPPQSFEGSEDEEEDEDVPF